LIWLTILIWLVFLVLTIRQVSYAWVRFLPLIGALPGLMVLIAENTAQGVFSTTEYALFVLSILLLIISVILLRRNRQRAIWGIGSAVVVLLLTMIMPVLAARGTLSNEASSLPPLPEATLTMNQIARDVYDQVLAIVSTETGLQPEVISQLLDSGEASVADMVRQADGDLEVVIQGITDVMTNAVQDLAAQGRMDETEAAFAISAMQTVVRLGVEFDLTGLMSRFEE